MPELPSGTVTFLFTDVEGSTRLLAELGDAYADVLAEHRRILREAFDRHGGVEVDTQGDAFFVSFASAREAVAAAEEAQAAFEERPIRVRMGLHTGEATVTGEGYVGIDVHRAARIAAAGHGGQVLLSQSTRDLLDGDVCDLGEHRLKDLSAREHLYQLGHADFPRLRTLYQTNLPIPATPFLGRDRELTEVSGLMERRGVRLLTLTGPGGTGKTRLALQAAAAVADRYPDGVWWVPLAPLRDPALVLDSAAQALGGKEGLAEQVGDRRPLLLLDNFEHVIAAAPRISELLQSCPNLDVLVTSRELLQLTGEHVYPVPALADSEAVELFLDRARSVHPGFDDNGRVRELCARLDNLPLALELAAARTRVFATEELLDLISRRPDFLKAGRDADPRQETLRATIEWSYDLLNEEERRLFARLAVFAGGCTREAAHEVCEANLDALVSLVDKSLVRRREDGRFWMLETIREFAAEKLEQSGEEETARNAHADWVLASVDQGEELPVISIEEEWFERVGREVANIRAALSWLAESGAPEKRARLACEARPYWTRKGPLMEPRAWLEEALQSPDLPDGLRRDVLYTVCQVTRVQGDGERCLSAAEEGLALCRQLDPEGPMVLEALRDLGIAHGILGDADRAIALHEEALAEARARGYHDRRITILLCNIGDLELMRRQWSRSREFSQQALALAQQLGDAPDSCIVIHNIGFAFLMESRFEEARPFFVDALRLAAERGLHTVIPDPLEALAAVIVAEGDAIRAARLLGAAYALRTGLGTIAREIEGERLPVTIAEARAELGDEAYESAFAEGAALTADEAVAYALESID